MLIDNFRSEESFLNFSTVSESVKHTIMQLLQDASQFNTNDVLVNLDHNSIVLIEQFTDQTERLQFDYTDQAIKSVLSRATKTQKEQGIFPLCTTQGFIEWEFKNSTVRSPLFIYPCEVDILKVSGLVNIQAIKDAVFVNPFVVNRLQKEFNISLPSEFLTPEQLTEFLKLQHFTNVEHTTRYFGNFHHHLFEIIKELEELKDLDYSSALSNLLGDESVNSSSKLTLGNELLFPADADQLKVFSTFKENHTVVQGPPGTGKSQVLTNLLGKLLRQSSSAIVVSEKRVALEVLQKKLQQFGLGDMCFIATSETLTKDILVALKNSWKELEQSEPKEPKPNLRLSEQYADQLQQQFLP